MGRLVHDTSDIFANAKEEPAFNDLVVVKPSSFTVNYQINPYMNKNIAVDTDLAMDQWENMLEELERDYNIYTIDPDEFYNKYDIGTEPSEIPDFVFSANHWTPLSRDREDGVLLSNFANSERQPEIEYVKRFLDEQSVPYVSLDAEFEGQGDFIWQNNKNILWAGHGIRTERAAVDVAKKQTGDDNLIVPLKLESDDHYHLDTCFRPLSEQTTLVVEEAFTTASYRRIEDAFTHIIKVPPNDFSCNSIVMSNNETVMSKSSTKWKTVEAHGFDVTRIEFEEFMKSGGSVACAVGPLTL